MSVYSATLSELSALGPAVVDTSEGQRALNLASILDDRDGIQAGGVASTDKQLGALMSEIRDRYKPVERSALTLLRGDGVA
jgi:hypothetical protein